MKTLAAFLLLASSAFAAEVTLAWDANPEPDISYRISYGTAAGIHPTSVEAGRNLEVAVPDLAEGVTYYFIAQAVAPDGRTSLPSNEISYTIPKPSNAWTVKFVDDEQADGYAAELAIDGNPATFWHTVWREGQPQTPMPHEIQIDMGAVKTLSGFSCLPRQDEWEGSNVKAYEFYLSLDGIVWYSPVSSGEIPQGKQLFTAIFPARSARYFRLVALSSHDGKQSSSIAELNVIETAMDPLPTTPKALRIK